MLSSPGNPLGSVTDLAELQRIAKVAQEKDSSGVITLIMPPLRWWQNETFLCRQTLETKHRGSAGHQWRDLHEDTVFSDKVRRGPVSLCQRIVERSEVDLFGFSYDASWRCADRHCVWCCYITLLFISMLLPKESAAGYTMEKDPSHRLSFQLMVRPWEWILVARPNIVGNFISCYFLGTTQFWRFSVNHHS